MTHDILAMAESTAMAVVDLAPRIQPLDPVHREMEWEALEDPERDSRG